MNHLIEITRDDDCVREIQQNLDGVQGCFVSKAGITIMVNGWLLPLHTGTLLVVKNRKIDEYFPKGKRYDPVPRNVESFEEILPRRGKFVDKL